MSSPKIENAKKVIQELLEKEEKRKQTKQSIDYIKQQVEKDAITNRIADVLKSKLSSK